MGSSFLIVRLDIGSRLLCRHGSRTVPSTPHFAPLLHRGLILILAEHDSCRLPVWQLLDFLSNSSAVLQCKLRTSKRYGQQVCSFLKDFLPDLVLTCRRIRVPQRPNCITTFTKPAGPACKTIRPQASGEILRIFVCSVGGADHLRLHRHKRSQSASRGFATCCSSACGHPIAEVSSRCAIPRQCEEIHLSIHSG